MMMMLQQFKIGYHAFAIVKIKQKVMGIKKKKTHRKKKRLKLLKCLGYECCVPPPKKKIPSNFFVFPENATPA